MKFLSKLTQGIKHTYDFIAKDTVIDELALNSKFGQGFVWIQLKMKPDGTNYLVLKTKGGEATVWVPIEFDDFEKAIEFARRHKP